MAVADRLLAAWYNGHPALCLLRPLSALYRRVVQGKRAAFLSGRKPAYRAPVPVIVVGNITVGGTGKCAKGDHQAGGKQGKLFHGQNS